MKNKWFTRGLLLVVAIVWGVIFYRVFAAISQKEDQPVTQFAGNKNTLFKMTDHAQDVVKLDLNYRDPFTNQPNTDLVKEAKPIQNNQQQNQALPKPQISWPELVYTGYIYNPDLKKKVAILRLNGKELMLTEGQSFGSIKLLKLAGDSVKIQYQKLSKYISLN